MLPKYRLGDDRGRIWRVVRTDAPPARFPAAVVAAQTPAVPAPRGQGLIEVTHAADDEYVAGVGTFQQERSAFRGNSGDGPVLVERSPGQYGQVPRGEVTICSRGEDGHPASERGELERGPTGKRSRERSGLPQRP
jgi:hypothetical protein